MDRFCTLGNVEQSLDRLWTKVGQSLDFDVQSLDLAVQSLDLGVQATIDKEHPISDIWFARSSLERLTRLQRGRTDGRTDGGREIWLERLKLRCRGERRGENRAEEEIEGRQGGQRRR